MSATPFAGFAVIDLETTGLFPGGHDRVVEIGIVDLDQALRPVAEWTTLVNPLRDVGPTNLHGITASQVADAPVFAELVGDVAACLADRVVVGHNVRFDLGFLDAEFGHAGYRVAWEPGLCTMALASSIIGARRLDECCECFGIDTGRSHSALCDARSTALLLACCLQRLQSRPPQLPPPLAREVLPAVPPSGRSLVRGAAPAPPRTSLASLVTRLPLQTMAVEANPDAVVAYIDMLDRALEDRRLTPEEIDHLASLACTWGLGSPAVFAIHRYYFGGLARLALADGVVTDLERQELLVMAGLLGVPDVVNDLHAAAAAPTIAPHRAAELRGKTVCFTGTSVCSIDGEPLSRELQEELAAEAGLVPVGNVTKRLSILVLADPASMSGKSKKADEYGVRKMAERTFWAALEIAVD
jgi:DNA polymerase III subunit epsilon